eukprot:TRINITY_DN31198_c0_g1_i1.p1 TRINITY_DN31198_c0_g1~~TRINITY_DN31198_c0_g1_i1.p1  ORF type:complete len:162 (+),score=20.79 TRINITY_DN31198_c0_g1_i1:44-529(+)
MGCGLAKSASGSEVIMNEPSPLHCALRMKRCSIVAGLKIAMARDLYSDTRSASSLESSDRRRLESWVKEVPACSSDSDETAESRSVTSDESLHTIEENPFVPEPLPPARSGCCLSPVRLTTKMQLVALEEHGRRASIATSPLDVVLRLPPAARKQLPPLLK